MFVAIHGAITHRSTASQHHKLYEHHHAPACCYACIDHNHEIRVNEVDSLNLLCIRRSLEERVPTGPEVMWSRNIAASGFRPLSAYKRLEECSRSDWSAPMSQSGNPIGSNATSNATRRAQENCRHHHINADSE